jgi:anaerobic selenocysteine-containing dehydrogenase
VPEPSASVLARRTAALPEERETTTHLHTCTLCEASCGIVVTVDDGRIADIRGDKDDPHSRGFLCPKARALSDVHDDPDRLRRPIVRTADGWVEVGWEEAFDLVARRLREVRRTHGRDAVAVYQGNPSAHNFGLLTMGQLLFRGLRTHSLFSASSLDQLPQMVASYLMFGHQWMLPVPDIDRTDLFICVGANPAASNGSVMTAPNVKGRMKAVRARGGRVVMIDPRRTESAALADEHIAIRPGTDALLLLSMMHVLFEEHLVRITRPAVGVDELRGVASRFAPEVTAVATGIDPDVVRRLARSLATTERAVLYGRVGLSTQEFGGLCGWLLVALNALTGHLDEIGGAMFSTPAVDILRMSTALGARGSYAKRRSRVRGLPEVGGELPTAVLAEEIETPGAGQIRALITSAGNPVLSSPNGARLERALPKLDFMVAIDWYLNETTRLADVILPPTAHLERSHYDVLFLSFAVHNSAKYSPPVFERADDQRHDWEICVEVLTRTIRVPIISRIARRLLLRSGPEGTLSMALATGPHGLLRGGLSLRRLRRSPHGVDLGPLESRLPRLLRTRGKKVQLAPQQYLDDLPRLRARLDEWSTNQDGLVLVGRRHLRSNNSWMHNSPSLMEGKGHPTCTLLMHPRDATALGLSDGEVASIGSTAGRIEAPVEISDEVMPGVVSLPHGWGHHREGARLRVAGHHPGVSLNDVTDDQFVDVLTGTAALSGIPVTIRAAAKVAESVSATAGPT